MVHFLKIFSASTLLLIFSSNTAFSLQTLRGEQLFKLFDQAQPISKLHLKTELHIGYCYSSYPNKKEDHIHGENGEIIPIDPESIPDESIVIESSLLWVDADRQNELKAKASFGKHDLSDFDRPETHLAKLDQRAALLSFDAKEFKPNKNDSSWSFLNSQNQITQTEEGMYMIFEYVIVNTNSDQQLIAQKLKIMKSLTGKQDLIKTESYCHYPKTMSF
jgi:hypothetical protein